MDTQKTAKEDGMNDLTSDEKQHSLLKKNEHSFSMIYQLTADFLFLTSGSDVS